MTASLVSPCRQVKNVHWSVVCVEAGMTLDDTARARWGMPAAAQAAEQQKVVQGKQREISNLRSQVGWAHFAEGEAFRLMASTPRQAGACIRSCLPSNPRGNALLL